MNSTNQPQLVQAGGKLLAFNNLYPDRHVVTRHSVAIPDWACRQADVDGP